MWKLGRRLKGLVGQVAAVCLHNFQRTFSLFAMHLMVVFFDLPGKVLVLSFKKVKCLNLPLLRPHWHLVLDRCVPRKLCANSKPSGFVKMEFLALANVLTVAISELVLVFESTVGIHWFFCQLMLVTILAQSWL